MTTGTKKIVIIFSMAVVSYLLYKELLKNKAQLAAKPAVTPGDATAPPVTTTSNIVAGDHTGTPAPGVQTAGGKPVQSIAVGEYHPTPQVTAAGMLDSFFAK